MGSGTGGGDAHGSSSAPWMALSAASPGVNVGRAGGDGREVVWRVVVETDETISS